MMRWLLAFLAVALVPASAPAQTAKIQKEIDKTLHQMRVYEDIEVMRRLLSRKLTALVQSCQRCHGGGGGGGDMGMAAGALGLAGMPGAGRERAAPPESLLFDGVYLPGQGVVLQAQVSATFFAVNSAPGPKPAAKLNEWEMIRKQLRGEKVENVPALLDGHHQLNMPDVLLAALAESGKHFDSLRDNEKLTVAITFSPGLRWEGLGDMGMGAGFGAADPFGAPPGIGPMGGSPLGPMGSGPPPQPGTAGPGGSGFGPGELPPAGRGTSKDYELLADYHLKQSRYDEAAKSLRKAITLNNDPMRESGLQRKLAIAYLMLDQYQRADADVVAKALDAIKKAAEGKKTDVTPQRPMILPQRLIVSATRQALQQASSERLDEFRRQASVEWLRFNHPVQGADYAGP